MLYINSNTPVHQVYDTHRMTDTQINDASKTVMVNRLLGIRQKITKYCSVA